MMPGIRPAQPIRAVRVGGDGRDVEVMEFASLAKTTGHFKFDRDTIKRRLDTGETWNGWRFERRGCDVGVNVSASENASAIANANKNNKDEGAVTNVVETVIQPRIDPMTYLLGPDAYELLRGKSIRVTNDGRMSLYDFIEAMTGNENGRTTWDNIKDKIDATVVQKIYNWKFPGARQRDTPVITAEDAILVANHLRGPLADHLRRRCAELGKDMAGGNVDKVVGVAVAIDAHHRAGLSQGTLAALCRDTKGNETLELDLATMADTTAVVAPTVAKPTHKYMLMSPRMQHVNLVTFANKSVCYLLSVVGGLVKFGYTTDILTRYSDHMREIPELVGIWFVCEAPKEAEGAFRDYMRYAGKLVSVRLGGKNQTELLQDITLECAEFELCRIVQAVCVRSDVEIRKLELEVEKQKLDVEKQKLDVEKHKLDMGFETEKLKANQFNTLMNLLQNGALDGDLFKLALEKI